MRGIVERVDPAHPHDDFWTWREAMYAAAGRLDPESAHAVALLAYREMVAAGYVAVGEFHYVHHRPDGSPYTPANAMALATAAAADEAGIAQVLLMTAYERAGAGAPPTPGQRRFCDPTVAAYLERVDALAQERPGRVGLAPHSVRAVSRPWLEEIGRYVEASGMVVHIHACEQRREISESQAEYGRRPIELLADAGVLGPRTTIVHATHASDGELDLIAQAGASVCLCPTTEANLGDGFLPVARVSHRGIGICIGSDSNARIDPLEELRELEGIARRQTGRRGVLPLDALLGFGSDEGAAALGLESWPDAVVDLDHRQLRGVDETGLYEALVFSCGADVLWKTSAQ
jgi:formimidoylglutamate deiminase